MDLLKSPICVGLHQPLDSPSEPAGAPPSPAGFSAVLAAMAPEAAPDTTGADTGPASIGPGGAGVAAAAVAPAWLVPSADPPGVVDPAPPLTGTEQAAPSEEAASADQPATPSAASDPPARDVSPLDDDAPAAADADSRPLRRRAVTDGAALVAPMIPPPVQIAIAQPVAASAPAIRSGSNGPARHPVAAETVSPTDVPAAGADADPTVAAPALSALIAAHRHSDDGGHAAARVPEATAATIEMLAGRRGLGSAAAPAIAAPAAEVPAAEPVAVAVPPDIAIPRPSDAGPSLPAASSPAGPPAAAAAPTLPSRAPRTRLAVPAPLDATAAASASAPVAAVVVTATPDAVPTASGMLAADGAGRQIELVRHAAWADGIAHDIASAGAASGTARFTVAPATLGAVAVEVSRTADGAAVRLVASSAAARDALDAARPQLVAEARAQGLRIHDAQVDLAGSAGGTGSGSHRDTGQPPAAMIADQPRATNGVETNSLTTGAYGGAGGGEAGRQAQQHARHQVSPPQTDRTATTRQASVPRTDTARRAADGRYA